MAETRRKEYWTRSKAKRSRQIMAEQPRCPLSLDPFTEDTLVFEHCNVRFDAVQMRDYLIAVPGAANPVNREPMTDVDIDRLEKICSACPAKDILRGDAAREASISLQQEQQNLSYFENEAKNCLVRFSTQWNVEDDDDYHNYLSLFRNALIEIMNDVKRLNNGHEHWNMVLLNVVEFSHQQVFVPEDVEKDFNDTIQYLQRNSIHSSQASNFSWNSFPPIWNSADDDSESDYDFQDEVDQPERTTTPRPQNQSVCPPYTRFSSAVDPRLIPSLYSFLDSTSSR